MTAEFSHSNVRILMPEQAHALLDVHVRVSERSSARDDDAPHDVVRTIAGIVVGKAALVIKDDGVWTMLAESGEGPAVPAIAAVASHVFDRVGDAPTVVIERWTSNDEDWTLVGLTRRSTTPAVLMLHRDWTLSASTLRRLGENLLLAERAY